MSGALDAIFARLSANARAAEILADLDRLPPEIASRGRALLARGIALNRASEPMAALSALTRAADQFQEAGDAASLATAYQQIGIVWYWRGDIAQAHRWFALAQAQALQAGDTGTAALTMLDTARLMLETGHPGYAAQMLRAGLSFGAGVLPELQVQRAQIALLQCHVRLGDHPLAEQVLAALAGQTLPPRLACLRDLERARLAAATYDLDHADSLLAQCPGKWQNPDSFEAAEHGHVRAEVALARQNWAAARGALAPVLARYAADDLAAREIDARLLMARAWDGEGDLEARTATLMAALRRALARNLSGYADAVRKALIGYGDLAQGMAGPEGRLEARFVRRGVVAQGRRGTVFRAYDLESGADVALKQMRLAAEYDPARRAAVLDAAQREAATAMRVNHPGVARILGLFIEPDGDAFIASDLIEGPTLRAAMGSAQTRTQWRDIVQRIAQAAAAFHQAGLVYCDLKPENIILRNGAWPVLIDFDAAARVSLEGRARPVAFTQGYAAPELVEGRAVTAAADAFAIGVIAVELLTGQMPPRLTRPGLFSDGGAGALIRTLTARGADAGTATAIAGCLNPDAEARMAHLAAL